MKIFKNLKKKHYFLFKKTRLNIQGNNLKDLTYNIISDAYLFWKAKKIADCYNCKIISFNRQEWSLDGLMITIYATKDNYINFCTDFCSTFKKYIEDIEIK